MSAGISRWSEAKRTDNITETKSLNATKAISRRGQEMFNLLGNVGKLAWGKTLISLGKISRRTSVGEDKQ